MAALYMIAAVIAAAVLAFAGMCIRVRCLARKKREPVKSDCIIVLGAKVWPDGRPCNALRYRCERALEIYRMVPGIKIIPCGGRHSFEPVSEASAMQKYFLECGVSQDDIILEEKSRSTIENLAFAKAIMEENGFSTAMIVTSDYHAERALWMSRDTGIKACAVAAKSPKKIKTVIKITVQESISWIKYLLMRKKNASH